jgi:hypothetical protein
LVADAAPAMLGSTATDSASKNTRIARPKCMISPAAGQNSIFHALRVKRRSRPEMPQKRFHPKSKLGH